MAKYVIHKKGFFYTDEAFEAVEGEKGSIVGMYSTLEEAKEEKRRADIQSVQNLAGMNAVDFFFYSDNYDAIFNALEALYKTEFGIAIEDKDYFEFPENIDDVQAEKLLEIIGVTFHDIVEYADDVAIDPDDFEFSYEELGEF